MKQFYLLKNLRKKRDAEGYGARYFQHKTDHCDGRLFIDHLPKMRRDMLVKKFQKEKRWK